MSDNSTSRRSIKSNWLLAGTVGNESTDFAFLVRVSVLIEGYRDELMRRNKIIEELLDLSLESIPVCLGAWNDLGNGIGITLVHCVPERLASSITDILSSTGYTDHVDRATFLLVAVNSIELSVPRLCVVEGFVRNVVQRDRISLDLLFAVEDCENVVAVLDVSLVSSDADQSVSSETIVLDPLLHSSDVGK